MDRDEALEASLQEYKSIKAYQNNILLLILLGILVIGTAGLFGLFCLWSLKLRTLFKKRCNQVDATMFLIRNQHDVETEVYVQKDSHGQKFFEFQCIRFVWDDNSSRYIPAPDTTKTWTHADILTKPGLSGAYYNDPNIRVKEGPNLIDVPMNPLWWDVVKEFLGPVYIYQYLCCALWMAHGYEVFAAILIVAILISGSVDIYTVRTNQLRIKKLAAFKEEVEVNRDNTWSKISSMELLPGDVVSVPLNGGFKVPCDLVVISGTVVADESSLTGESLPVMKSPPPSSSKIFSHNHDKKHIVHSGTIVLNASPAQGSTTALCKVTRIGFKTTKGDLVRSILTAPIVKYPYEREAKIFLGVLVIVGIGFFLLSLYFWGGFRPNSNYANAELWLFAFEAVAILVPPTLPLVFHVGLLLSAKNLENNNGVYAVNPSRIPLAGKVHIFCFDKTGTLTKPDLEVIGTVSTDLSSGTLGTMLNINQSSPELRNAIGVCHSLNRMPDGVGNLGDHQYTGPVLDVKMFKALGWTYTNADHGVPAYSEDNQGPNRFEILRRFDFDHTLQRMSVIVRLRATGELFLFSKGSPEMISTICSSTPRDHSKIAQEHAKNGAYVLGFGMRPCPEVNLAKINEIPRESVESNLTLLGFLLLRNEIKQDSEEAIRQLKAGHILPKIITGDNAFTAFYIAKQCNIVRSDANCYIGQLESEKVVWRNLDNPDDLFDPVTLYDKPPSSSLGLAVTSEAFDKIRATQSPEIFIKHVNIFARMKPHQKEACVRIMQAEDRVVGMCGDGANDCSALSVAHCGIALSEAEASLVAPFSSKFLTCMATADAVREGRACLANSFSAFKYTLFYGLTQTLQMILAFSWNADFSQAMYVWEDFLVYVPISFFVVKSNAAKKIDGVPPTSRVFGPITLGSLFGQIAITMITILLAVILLHGQDWYFPDQDPSFDVSRDAANRALPEVTTVFFVGMFLYITAGISFTFGGRWRNPFYKNYGLMGTAVITFFLAILLLFVSYPATGLADLFHFYPLPLGFRGTLFFLGIGGSLCMLFWEKFVILGDVGELIKSWLNPPHRDLVDEDADDKTQRLYPV